MYHTGFKSCGRLWQAVFLGLVITATIGCQAPVSNPTPPLKLSSASVVENPDPNAPQTTTYDAIACFNRPLTARELEPGVNYNHQYGIEYTVKFRNQWRDGEVNSYQIAPVQSVLTRQNNKCFRITGESSYHPPRGFDREADENFTQDNIASILVILHERNKSERHSEYREIDRQEFLQ